jgi:hypothetical protein
VGNSGCMPTKMSIERLSRQPRCSGHARARRSTPSRPGNRITGLFQDGSSRRFHAGRGNFRPHYDVLAINEDRAWIGDTSTEPTTSSRSTIARHF